MEKKYKCEYCKRGYAQLWALQNHEKQCTYKPKKSDNFCGTYE